ncbi:hypothetical protein ACJQWK_00846 [Exserohilum turcicum]
MCLPAAHPHARRPDTSMWFMPTLRTLLLCDRLHYDDSARLTTANAPTRDTLPKGGMLPYRDASPLLFWCFDEACSYTNRLDIFFCFLHHPRRREFPCPIRQQGACTVYVQDNCETTAT